MPNVVFKANTREGMNFIEALNIKSHLLEGIPNEFVISRLKDLTIFESPPATEAGHIIVKFRIPGTVEAFIASTLRAYDGERFTHDSSSERLPKAPFFC